jgi:hypothetical protein
VGGSIGGYQSNSHKQGGIEREREREEVVQTAKDEERIFKEESMNELSESCLLFLFFLPLLLLFNFLSLSQFLLSMSL